VPLTAIGGIEQMQIVQPSMTEIVLNIVRAPDYNDASEAALRAEFAGVFGPQTTITVVAGERIPQELSGKYRFSICRI